MLKSIRGSRLTEKQNALMEEFEEAQQVWGWQAAEGRGKKVTEEMRDRANRSRRAVEKELQRLNTQTRQLQEELQALRCNRAAMMNLTRRMRNEQAKH